MDTPTIPGDTKSFLERHFSYKTLLLVFIGSIFLLLIAFLGSVTLHPVTSSARLIADRDIPSLLITSRIESLLAKESFVVSETLRKNVNAYAVSQNRSIFETSAQGIGNELAMLRDYVPVENLSIYNDLVTRNQEYYASSIALFDLVGKTPVLSESTRADALHDLLSKRANLENGLYQLTTILSSNSANDMSGFSGVYKTVYVVLLLIGLFGLLFAAYTALMLRKQPFDIFFAEDTKHTHDLVKLNSDLNASNKLLVEREMALSEVNQKLEESNALKSEFVSTVAHQLRTPLSGIKWTLDMFINGDMGSLSIEQKTYMMKLLETNERMIRFVNDLLSVSRIESGRIEYTFTPSSLEHIASSVLLDIYPLANRKSQHVLFRGKGIKFPMVAVDKEKMRVVLQNLLENAVKYTKEGGHITLELRNRGKDVLVGVIDDGMGIPKEYQKCIFTRFYRSPTAVKAQSDGSGLGLYLAKAIVEAHGGKIWFESSEGVGTSFYFTVPVPRKV